LKDTWSEIATRESPPIGIMIMDIDEFKNVNDLYGHNVG
jgi:diguanylate cyclase (GGDEF)-like protein